MMVALKWAAALLAAVLLAGPAGAQVMVGPHKGSIGGGSTSGPGGDTSGLGNPAVFWTMEDAQADGDRDIGLLIGHNQAGNDRPIGFMVMDAWNRPSSHTYNGVPGTDDVSPWKLNMQISDQKLFMTGAFVQSGDCEVYWDGPGTSTITLVDSCDPIPDPGGATYPSMHFVEADVGIGQFVKANSSGHNSRDPWLWAGVQDDESLTYVVDHFGTTFRCADDSNNGFETDCDTSIGRRDNADNGSIPTTRVTSDVNGTPITFDLDGFADVSDHTSNPTLDVDDFNGDFLTNNGNAGTLTLNLPDCVAAGRSMTAYVADAQSIVVNPDNGDQILGLTDAAGDSITNSGTVGDSVTLVCISASEIAASATGTWNDTN